VAAYTRHKLLSSPRRNTSQVNSFKYQGLNSILESFDWVKQGVVNPIKNQVRCGKKFTANYWTLSQDMWAITNFLDNFPITSVRLPILVLAIYKNSLGSLRSQKYFFVFIFIFIFISFLHRLANLVQTGLVQLKPGWMGQSKQLRPKTGLMQIRRILAWKKWSGPNGPNSSSKVAEISPLVLPKFARMSLHSSGTKSRLIPKSTEVKSIF